MAMPQGRSVWPAMVMTLAILLAACQGTTAPSASSAPPSSQPTQEPSTAPSASAPAPLSSDELQAAALDRAGQALSDADLDLAFKCWTDNVCTTGRGNLTVALADGIGNNVFRQLTHMEFVLAALSYPDVSKIIYVDAHGSGTEEISNVQSLIAQKVDVLLIFPFSGESAVPILKQAAAAGIVVVPYFCGPCFDQPEFAAAVGEDFGAFGVQQADTAIQVLNGEGNVVYLSGTAGNPVGPAWQKGADDEFAAKNSNIKVLGKADTDWTQEGAFKATSAFLAQYDKIDGVLYDYTNALNGVVRAFEQANRPIPLLTSIGDDNGLFGQWEKLSPSNPDFVVAYTKADTKVVRFALEAGMDKVKGIVPPSKILFVTPLIILEKGLYRADLPPDFPLTTFIPIPILQRMFGR